MGQQTLASFMADMPPVVVLLFSLVNLFLVIYLIRDRRRARTELEEQVQDRVRAEMDQLTEDTRRTNDDARQLLASISLAKAGALEENARFQQQIEAAREEIQRIVSEIRSVRQYVTKITPPPEEEALPPAEAAQARAEGRRSRENGEWSSPEDLLRMARQSDEWANTASYLARMDTVTATSGNLESAGDICRDQGFLAKAIEFYRQAMSKDGENLTARAEFLALSAKAHASEREESLRLLQDLITRTLTDAAQGPGIRTIFFTVMTELGRERDLAAFCEAQLLLPLPRVAQLPLHRHLTLLYKNHGKTDDALLHCDAAVRLAGDDVDLLVLHSQLLFSARNYEEAYRLALRSLQHDPTLARSYVNLAIIQEKRMGRPAARELLNKAVQFASAAEMCHIEENLRRMAALDDLSEIVPSTGPQLIRA
jgi:tetratricopeptide (TPR) repeat protein